MLQIKNLHVEVEGKKILNGIDIHIKKGEMHAIMGLNGSGKSTLSNAILNPKAFRYPIRCVPPVTSSVRPGTADTNGGIPGPI